MLARGKVRYVGEPVAAVAAIDSAIANAAAAAIEVDYEPLDAVLTIDEALAPTAPILHEELASYVKAIEGGGHRNVVWEAALAEGDVEVPEQERELIEAFRRELDAGMWAAVPTETHGGRLEAELVKSFAEVPRDAERVIFFPRAAGGAPGATRHQ